MTLSIIPYLQTTPTALSVFYENFSVDFAGGGGNSQIFETNFEQSCGCCVGVRTLYALNEMNRNLFNSRTSKVKKMLGSVARRSVLVSCFMS